LKLVPRSRWIRGLVIPLLVGCGNPSGMPMNERGMPSVANPSGAGGTGNLPAAGAVGASPTAAIGAGGSRVDGGARHSSSPQAGDGQADSGGAGGDRQVADAGKGGGKEKGSGVSSAPLPDAGVTSKWPIAKDGWPMAKPEDYGLDASQLEGIAQQLQAASGDTRAGLVVVKEGALIFEQYWSSDADTKNAAFSCTKSWGSTLIGIAVRQKLLTVEDAVTRWVPNPAPEVGGGALIKHLLTQTAQTTPPGQQFEYNSGSIVNTLPEILEAAAGTSSHAFFERHLAMPLQLSMDWPSCPAGGCAGTRYGEGYIQFGDEGPNSVVMSTVRDQAKLGWLWLNDGVWNGQKLLDADYIKAATQPSFDFQAVYGYLWWLNRQGPSVGPYGAPMPFNPDVPSDMFHAVGGVGNCSVAVLPTQRMVIAHMGSLDSGGLGGHWEVFAPLFKP
jgi:CubicO group peptidase (beta-lactamase class C family)